MNPAKKSEGRSVARRCAVLLIAAVLLALSGCNSVFFQPNRRLYFTPEQFNLAHEEVRFRSADGAELHGWFLPGRSPVRGTIVHFHGNAANVTNHLYAVRWLPPEGFSVFLFDYRGYGESEGSPSREGAIADGEAAIRYVRGRPDVEPERLIVYGQSLGGALAVGALARAGIAGVKALVIEGGFASYREEVRLILDSTWLTWPFQYPVAYLLFSDALRPLDDLPRIADVPLLVIHGQTDATVRIENGLQLYEAFPGKTKAFWAVPGADHMEVFSRPESPWRTRLLAYLRAAVDGSAP